MERNRAPVKSKRHYDSTRRQQQAHQTRADILEVARRRFLANGFAPTTIAAIAADVGVAVDTLYKPLGGKRRPIPAISEQALAGDGLVPAETRSDSLHARERDPRAIL